MNRNSVKPFLIIFLGEIAGSFGEQIVGESHIASTLDLVEQAQQTGVFGGIILVTNVKRLPLPDNASDKVIIETSRDDFHFGRELQRIIHKYRIEKPFYIGGGSAPLLTTREMKSIADTLASSDNTVITNNYYSSDLIAFSPGSAIDAINLTASDNSIARLLAEAGLRAISLPRKLSTRFDIDTPSDLLLLSALPGLKKHLKRFLDALDLDRRRLDQVVKLCGDNTAEILVAGRVGSSAWSRLEKGTRCRFRVLSEERGMRADGREDAGTVHSILGLYLEKAGIRDFFSSLSQLGSAAIIDTRVIFNHFRLAPSRSDRFNSDLGRADLITDRFIREFTEEAIAAPVPVLMGGHSLVSGGLLALIEIARRRKFSPY